jgi:hypothetical protein
MASPGVTLTATLQDTSGDDDFGAWIRITLCNYGAALPRVIGTSMLVKIKQRLALAEGILSIPLWGNYQINPTGTYYDIALLDEKQNVVQSGLYQFMNPGTYDLSNLGPYSPGPPYIPPVGDAVLLFPPGQALQTVDGPLTVQGNVVVTGTVNGAPTLYVVPINSGTPVFDGSQGQGMSLTLSQNVTSSTAINFPNGVLIPVILKQNATGGYTMTWPTNWKSMPAVNLAPNGVTSFAVMLDETGAFYPVSSAVWSVHT